MQFGGLGGVGGESDGNGGSLVAARSRRIAAKATVSVVGGRMEVRVWLVLGVEL